MSAEEQEVLKRYEDRKGRGKRAEPPAPPLEPPPNRATPPTDDPTSQTGAHDDPVASKAGEEAGTNADHDSDKRTKELPLEHATRRKYGEDDAEEDNMLAAPYRRLYERAHEFELKNAPSDPQEDTTVYSGARGSADYVPPSLIVHVNDDDDKMIMYYPEGRNPFRDGYVTPEEYPNDNNAKPNDGDDNPDKAGDDDSEENFGPHNVPQINDEDVQRVSGLAHILVRILRHTNESHKLFVDKFGFAAIEDVLKLRCVVNAEGTKRDICCLNNKMFADKDGPIFEINASWTKIRAIQGHTAAISPFYAYMHLRVGDCEDMSKPWAHVFMGACEVYEMLRDDDGMLPNDNEMYIKCYPVVGIEDLPRMSSACETALVYALIDLKHFINRPEEYTVFKTHNDVMLISGVNDQIRLFRGQVLRFQDCTTKDIILPNDLKKHVDDLIGDGTNPPRFATEAIDEPLDDLIKRDKEEVRDACINMPEPRTEEQKQWHRDYVKAILESRFKREPCKFAADKCCRKRHLCTYQHAGDNNISIQQEIATITERYSRKEMDKRLAKQRYRPEPSKREISKADREEDARRRSRSNAERVRARDDDRYHGSSRRYETTRGSGSGDPRNYNTGRSKKDHDKRSPTSYEDYTDSEEEKHGRYHRRR